MSYWVSLESDGGAVSVKPHAEGGTYVMGGTDRAELNVTYNYSNVYAAYGFSLRDLDGKRAGDMMPILAAVVEQCGIRRSDYWRSTRGNAGYALSILHDWAHANPDAVFRVR